MSRRPKITVELIHKWIEAGYGQGHGENYQPFLQIRRWNPSAVSSQVVGCITSSKSRGAFLSRNEWKVAHALVWCGAEVRMQYPAWSWPHPHPLYGLHPDYQSKQTWSRGMLAICTDMGIDHGLFPGTQIPYIWTLDFVLTFWMENQKPVCSIVSVKPVFAERFINPDVLDRSLSKLEAEKRYARELVINYVIAGHELFPEKLITQLALYRSAAALPEKDCRYYILQRFLDKFSGVAYQHPVSEWVNWMQTDFHTTYAQALFVAHHCLWHQYIDADLTKHIDYKRVLAPGGRKIREKLRKALIGGDE